MGDPDADCGTPRLRYDLYRSIWLALAVPLLALPQDDMQRAREYVAGLERQAESAPDRCAVVGEIARSWGYFGRNSETLAALKDVVDLNAGFDLARDPPFAKLRGLPEFEFLVERVRATTPPVVTSTVAFKVAEGDLVPENLAYDPAKRDFYFGSTRKNKIVRCSAAGACRPFVAQNRDGLGAVTGIKVERVSRTLWALSDAALFHYDLASGRLIRRYVVSGTHAFNDLVVTSTGDVYFTDTRGSAVYRLLHGRDAPEVLGSASFPYANGIALSSDQRKLYVSSFGNGISLVDADTGAVRPVGRAADVCLAWIDGLYSYTDSLIAIQNGPMTPRVVRLYLNAGHDRIERLEVLERRNPLFDGVTTGVIAGNAFYFMANNQSDKPAGTKFDPISILMISLKPH